MPEELLREIRKLEARLENFLEGEEDFVKGLRSCLEKFKELNNIIEKLETRPNSRRLRELTELRLGATKMLTEALKRESKAEHEKSHLLESYGVLILALEEQYQRFYSTTWLSKSAKCSK